MKETDRHSYRELESRRALQSIPAMLGNFRKSRTRIGA